MKSRSFFPRKVDNETTSPLRSAKAIPGTFSPVFTKAAIATPYLPPLNFRILHFAFYHRLAVMHRLRRKKRPPNGENPERSQKAQAFSDSHRIYGCSLPLLG